MDEWPTANIVSTFSGNKLVPENHAGTLIYAGPSGTISQYWSEKKIQQHEQD